MRPSIRNKYFGWLLLLITLIYFLIFLVFVAIEYHESVVEGTPFSHEYPEFYAILGVMLFTMPATLIIAWNIAGKLFQPLNEVLTTAERISRGNLDERVPPLPHADELARLADTINGAFDRYAAAVQRLEQFSADASHQLRTPLAAIRASAEVNLGKERGAEEYQSALGDILEQTERLNLTIDQLIALARLDQSITARFVPVDMAERLRDWTAEASEILRVQAHSLTTHIEDGGSLVLGDVILLRQVFDNLINNAMENTPPGGAVHVSWTPVAGEPALQWTIEDAGPGIPENERNLIFERFYRGASPTGHGSGLGLAIVRQILQLHGGTVRVETSKSLGGAAFVIRLPAAVPAPGPSP